MFNSRFNRVLAVVLWLSCLACVIAVIASASASALTYLPLIALIAWLTWAGLWRPFLAMDDENITVVNVFATTVVPWAALIHVDTHYALTLITPGRRIPVTAAPAPGRLATALSKNEMKGISAPMGPDGRVRAGDIPSSDSGAAAHLVRQRWALLLAEDRIDVGTAHIAHISRRLHWAVISFSVILTLASFMVIALN